MRAQPEAFSEMLGHMAPQREFYTPFVDSPRSMIGIEDCESFHARLKAKRAIIGQCLL